MLVLWWAGADGPEVGDWVGGEGGYAEGEVLVHRGDEAGVEDLAHARRFGADGVANVVCHCVDRGCGGVVCW